MDASASLASARARLLKDPADDDARAKMLSDKPFERPVYEGRASLIEPSGLRELWIQINNNCNLTCSHCLVSSGPGGIKGLDTGAIVRRAQVRTRWSSW